MDGYVEHSLAPALGRFAVAGILCDVGDQARIEHALPIVRGIKAAIEIEVGPSQVHPDLPGHLLQGVQALGQEHYIRFMDGSYDRAMVVDDRDDLLAFLVLITRVAN